jgi:hypothetical protein
MGEPEIRRRGVRTKTEYQWVAEELDEYGDIIDPMFEDRLRDLMPMQPGHDYALVKTVWDVENENLADRCYLYIQAGELPEEFTDGCAVPQKYINELNKENEL